MTHRAVQRCLFVAGFVLAAGCGFERSDGVSSVTIEVQCGSSADCPVGFACNTDLEHGPPAALCESDDPDASCPAGFETKVIYGQTFCKSPASATARAPRLGRAFAGRHRAGL